MVANWIDRHLAALYGLISLVFGVAIIVLTPPNGTPDEISHQVKIVRVASGNPFGADRSVALPNITAWYPGFQDSEMLNPRHRILSGTKMIALSRALDCRSRTTLANNAVASYSPILYFGPALTYSASCIGGASFGTYLYTARLCNLLLVTALLCWVMTRVTWPRWIMFSIALLPSAMYQIASIAGDALLIGLSVAFIGLLGEILTRTTTLRRGTIAAFVLTGLGVAMSKPGYVWLTWGGFTAVALFARRPGSARASLMIAGLAISVGLQGALLWLGRGSTPIVRDVDPVANFHDVVAHPLHFLVMVARVPIAYPFGTQWNVVESFLGKLGWLDAPLRPLVYALLTAGLIATLFASPVKLSWRTRLFLGCVAIGSVLIIALQLRLFATQLDGRAVFGLQGRYFLPTAGLSMLAVATSVPDRWRGAIRMVVPAVAIIALGDSVLALHLRY